MTLSRRTMLTMGIASLIGMAGCLSQATNIISDEDTSNENCNEPNSGQGFDYSRGGQLQAKPMATTNEDYPVIKMSSCLHQQVREIVGAAGDQDTMVLFDDISPDLKSEIKENLASEYGITSDRFFVELSDTYVRVTIIHND